MHAYFDVSLKRGAASFCEHCVLCDGRCKLPTLSLLQSVLIHAVHYVERLPSTGVGMPVGQAVLALTNGPYVYLYVVHCMYTPTPTSSRC